MVKWKKMNKKMAGLLLGVMMLFTASTTAFAYVDESAEASKVETTQTEQSTDKEEKKDDSNLLWEHWSPPKEPISVQSPM